MGLPPLNELPGAFLYFSTAGLAVFAKEYEGEIALYPLLFCIHECGAVYRPGALFNQQAIRFMGQGKA